MSDTPDLRVPRFIRPGELVGRQEAALAARDRRERELAEELATRPAPGPRVVDPDTIEGADHAAAAGPSTSVERDSAALLGAPSGRRIARGLSDTARLTAEVIRLRDLTQRLCVNAARHEAERLALVEAARKADFASRSHLRRGWLARFLFGERGK